ncbi:MAG: transposase, partial [Thermoplasmata archaeon]
YLLRYIYSLLILSKSKMVQTNGVNVIDFKDHSKVEDFQDFLLKIRENNGDKRIIAILDNFSTHRSKSVVDYANSLNIDLIFFRC